MRDERLLDHVAIQVEVVVHLQHLLHAALDVVVDDLLCDLLGSIARGTRFTAYNLQATTSVLHDEVSSDRTDVIPSYVYVILG